VIEGLAPPPLRAIAMAPTAVRFWPYAECVAPKRWLTSTTMPVNLTRAAVPVEWDVGPFSQKRQTMRFSATGPVQAPMISIPFAFAL